MKNHKSAKNATSNKANEKISVDFDSFEFKKLFYECLTKLKNIKFYVIKLATDFYGQPSYLLGERASFMLIVSIVSVVLLTVVAKYLRYSCEASDFGHKRDDTVRNFVKTESFRPRKTSWNTVDFR